MPRNMSFALTTRQIRNRTKTVTRRNGWRDLKPGEILNAVEKAMGLKKGEKIRRLCRIRVLSVRREPLNAITDEDVIKEGFPDMSAGDFVRMYCGHSRCRANHTVTRIEFEYLSRAHRQRR
jgi:hypothetical protein